MKKLLFLFFMVSYALLGVSQEKSLLGFEDYSKWNRIVNAGISPDGKWAYYIQQPNGGDETLFLKDLHSDSLKKIPYGSRVTFTEDAKWAFYIVGVSKAESKKLQAARKAIPSKVVLLNLQTGKEQVVDGVNRADFSTNSRHFVFKRRKSEEDKSKHLGTDMILSQLDNGQVLNIGNVNQYAFNKAGNLLAYTIDADQSVGNGLYVIDLADYSIRNLDAEDLTYSQLTWDDNYASRKDWQSRGKGIAVLKGKEADTLMHRQNQLVVVRNLGGKDIKKQSYSTASLAGFPAENVISENGNLRWSEDGKTVFFGSANKSQSLN